MLECGSWPTEADVRAAHMAHCPEESRGDFTDTLDELRESFISKNTFGQWRHLTWMHPSYRDLVIEELSQDVAFRRKFLQTCSVDGLKLAVSEAGGAAGTRRLPLMVDTGAWKTLTRRAIKLIESVSVDEACDILTSVAEVVDSTGDVDVTKRLVALLTAACNAARKRWDSERTELSGQQLAAFGKASIHLPELPKVPDLAASWEAGERRLHGVLHRESYEPIDERQLVEWMDLVETVVNVEPRLIAKKSFPADYEEEIESLITEIRMELETIARDDPDLMETEAERMDSLATVARGLAGFTGEHVEVAIELQNRLVTTAEELREEAGAQRPEEPDYENESGGSTGFDIAALFSDL